MRRALLLLILLLPAPAAARRMPTVGGDVRLALSADLADETARSARSVPLLRPPDPDDPPWLARSRPPLAGTDLRSDRVSALEGEPGGLVWRLGGEGLQAAVEDCLTGPAAWPAAALRSAGVTTSVAERPGGLLLRFSTPVGALPELLSGCPIDGPDAFAGDLPRLERAEGVGVHRLLFVPPGAPADLLAEGAAAPGRSLVVSAIDSVVLLIQGEQARADDPLGTGSGARGLAAFRDRLRPGLMAEVLAGGRAEAAQGLLPDRLAPRRPPPDDAGAAAPDRSASSLRLALDRGDGALLQGLAARLTALVDARGGRVVPEPGAASRLIQWGPPTRDPALALLALADQQPALRSEGLTDPRLLDASPARRLEAALDLERLWIDERRAVPLLSARRWIAVHQDLLGVRLRPDGVPLLDRAWWRVP